MRDRLEEARDRLERLRRELATARKVLAARLVEIYKADAPDALTVVLEADGFGDLLEHAEFLDRISEQDREITDEVRGLRDSAHDAGGSARRPRGARAARGRAHPAPSATRSRPAQGQLVSSRDELAAARADRRGALAQVRESARRRSRATCGRSRPSRRGCRRRSRAPAPAADQAGQRRADLAGQRARRLALRHALGPPPRGHRHRRAQRHGDPRGRLRAAWR